MMSFALACGSFNALPDALTRRRGGRLCGFGVRVVRVVDGRLAWQAYGVGKIRTRRAQHTASGVALYGVLVVPCQVPH